MVNIIFELSPNSANQLGDRPPIKSRVTAPPLPPSSLPEYGFPKYTFSTEQWIQLVARDSVDPFFDTMTGTSRRLSSTPGCINVRSTGLSTEHGTHLHSAWTQTHASVGKQRSGQRLPSSKPKKNFHFHFSAGLTHVISKVRRGKNMLFFFLKPLISFKIVSKWNNEFNNGKNIRQNNIYVRFDIFLQK